MLTNCSLWSGLNLREDKVNNRKKRSFGISFTWGTWQVPLDSSKNSLWALDEGYGGLLIDGNARVHRGEEGGEVFYRSSVLHISQWVELAEWKTKVGIKICFMSCLTTCAWVYYCAWYVEGEAIWGRHWNCNHLHCKDENVNEEDID